MYHTTGLIREQIQDVAAAVHHRHPELAITPRSRNGHHAVGFLRRVHLTICYLRLNISEAALAEFFDTSQPTASRIITAFTDAIAETLGELLPTGDDLDPDEQLIIDGSVLPCWLWRDRPDLYSGKYHVTGVNVQSAADHHGYLAWVSDPLPGSVHDSRALRETHILGRVLWIFAGGDSMARCQAGVS